MQINFIALLVAALVPMALGFIWYHPKLFGTVWMKHSGMTEEKAKSGNMALIFGLSFFFSLMLAVVINQISVHDGFIEGSLFYVNPDHSTPGPETEGGKWLAYYKENLAASNHTFAHGAFHGFFIAGLFLVLPVFATNALFERKSFKYVAVNTGYWLVCLTLMGGILGVWR